MSEKPVCRICHDGGVQEELLSCECSGARTTVHRSCLEYRPAASRTSFCKFCHHHFTEKSSKSLLEWLQITGLHQEMCTLFGDLVCFLLITPLATISGWLCLRRAVDYFYLSGQLEAVGLITLTVTLFAIYLFWVLVSLMYHCRLYSEWHRSNQNVTLFPGLYRELSAPHSSWSSQQKKNLSEVSVV